MIESKLYLTFNITSDRDEKGNHIVYCQLLDKTTTAPTLKEAQEKMFQLLSSEITSGLYLLHKYVEANIGPSGIKKFNKTKCMSKQEHTRQWMDDNEVKVI